MRTTRALLAAWQAVETSARTSGNPEVRAQVDAIRGELPGFLRELQSDLRQGKPIFDPQQGYAKRKKPGSDARRGIVVAPLRNRVVQRAMLDVLQTREPKIRQRLGGLPELVETPTSVGGIPERGPPDAVRLIQAAMQAGARYFVRSDISDFFTRIPRPPILDQVRQETGDAAFATMLGAALRTDLANEAELRERGWLHYFPDATTGVPQGSSLSAWCGNLLLHDFDRALNTAGTVTVRYIDDFVVLAQDRRTAQRAFQQGLQMLKARGLSARDPFAGDDPKAAHGTTATGFDFLSFALRPGYVAPSRAAKASLLKMVEDTIKQARQTMDSGVLDHRSRERCYAQTLTLLDDQVRGWGHAFRETNNRVEFHQLDERIDQELRRFEDWFQRRRRTVGDERRARRLLGVAILADTPAAGVGRSKKTLP
ncbi:reverse transcriptase domain-containing protein [Roseomonas elaeocarpi]|uniref:Reverse transcriptase domain-containing protein n=1 Tax=Roseomonas elaeocarpi TaxID=907779 RepID=A0ABV6JUU5_9PROT